LKQGILAPDKPSMRKEVSPPMPQERPVDIFDEGDYIKVIAEIPGVEEDDIKLIYKEINLPYL